ncbi:MAG: prolyl oligopeptidase family serine peptidase [Pseudomonadota bacterium]
MDALADAEGENWVYKGLNCLGPEERLCMISLSPGGSDAARWREFDLEAKAFVKGGFDVPVAKTWFDWVDEDHLLIGTNYGADSLTESGYPRTQRLWKRGTALAEAPEVFATDAKHMGLAVSAKHAAGKSRVYLQNILTFWTNQSRVFEPGKPPQKLPLPEDANVVDYGTDRVLALMRSAWGDFPAGSLVALDVENALAGGDGAPALIFAPGDSQAVQSVRVTRDAVYVVTLNDVSGELLRFTVGADGAWVSTPVDLPEAGTLSIIDADDASDRLFVQFESFTKPETLYIVDNGTPKEIDALPARFDASKIIAEQRFATSPDGTQVPYYVVRPKKLPKRKPAPVWLYGYGGFEIPVTPFYLSAKYQLWLEQGGVFVLGNIRGGGEYGPAWHQAALLKNRHKAFEDFAAIMDDMVASKLTDPAHIGVSGGSNGGLLTGVMLTRYADKHNGAIIGVPLADMLRYDRLLAGASWVGEYGDPDDADMRPYLAAYSPYHNVSADKALPEAFIFTSTKDDRVHPAHARKLAAALSDAGQSFLYYENIEGGHAGASNNIQSAYRQALELAFMQRRLMTD